jgi:hypothetical protein
MSRNRFIDLANALCVLANVDPPALPTDGGAIAVDGVDFFVQYDENIAFEHLLVYCEFGLPPASRLVDGYEALLVANLLVHGAANPSFMLGPAKQVVFGYRCALQALQASALLDICQTFSAQARAWRVDHFLDASPQGATQ